MFQIAGLVALIALLPPVLSQSQIYGQCGGIGWTGATSCVSGSTCSVINPYYSQCLPGSVGSTSATSITTVSSTPTSASTSSSPTSTGVSVGNPFTGYTLYLNPFYASEVANASALMSGSLATSASKIATIPSFWWMDVIAKVPTLETYLADASAKGKAEGTNYLLEVIVYDLPDRDCAAAASNGEFSIADDGEANYHDYIDQIVAVIQKYPDVRVVAIVEPDSLANLVTNLNVSKCANAQAVYLRCVTYAMQQLNTVGVYMYLDAGHAGWLGWPANISPAAQLFNSLYTGAGSPQFVRGLATNVANYNALTAASPDPITQGNPNYDEIHYIDALAPLLTAFPAHFIVDQGRSGVQNIRSQWGDWCNVLGAGFGTRPTLTTGSPYIDAIVWAKPGGECDGTSNTSAARYDYHCGLSDAKQPAPEAGSWFQAYFQDLVTYANPPL